MERRRTLWFHCSLLVFGGMFSVVARADTTSKSKSGIQLLNLPHPNHIYLDGREVKLDRGFLPCSPGKHEVQVETDHGVLRKVEAFRATVGVPNGIVTIGVELRPVYAIPSTLHDSYSLIPGPGGPMGPVQRHMVAPSDPQLIDTLFQELQPYISYDLQQIAASLACFPGVNRRGACYYQPSVDPKPLIRLRPQLRAPLPRGGCLPMPSGPSGLLNAVKSPTGESLCKAVKSALVPKVNESDLASHVNDILAGKRPNAAPCRFHLHTSSYGRRLMSAPSPFTAEPGPLGPPGPPGRPLPDQQPITLSQQQWDHLLTMLRDDKDIVARLKSIGEKMALIKKWVGEVP